MKFKSIILVGISIILTICFAGIGYNKYKISQLEKESAKICNIVSYCFNNDKEPTDNEKQSIQQYRDKYFASNRFNLKNRKAIFSVIDASGKLLFYYENKNNKDAKYLDECRLYALKISSKYQKQP